MKNIKKLWLLALAGVVTILTANVCPTEKKGGEEVAETTTIKDAWLWKKIDNIGGKVTEMIKSDSTTYAAVEDKGLFYLKEDGSWAPVDLANGKEAGSQTTSKDLENGKTVRLLTPLRDDRVIFVVDGKGVGVVKSGVVEAVWADGKATNIGNASDIKDITRIKGPAEKEIIVLVNGTKMVAFQADSNNLAPAWDNTIQKQGGGPIDKDISTLVLSDEGDALYLGQSEAPKGYLRLAGGAALVSKAQIQDANPSVLGGQPGNTNAAWKNTVLPEYAKFTPQGLVASIKISDVVNEVVFVKTANLKGGDSSLILRSKVNYLMKFDDKIYILYDKGIFVVNADGTQNKDLSFDGTFTGKNYEDKIPAELAKIPEKELPHAKLDSANILDIVLGTDVKYYITDKGVWFGQKGDIKVKK